MSTQNALMTILLEKINNDTLVLPTLPAIALKVRKATDDPDIDLNKVAEVVGQDPALSARMIKIANSAYMGRTVKVETLYQAITRIGLRQIKNIATALAMEQLFVSKNEVVANYMQLQWKSTVNLVANSMAVLGLYTERTKQRELCLDAITLSALVSNIGVLPILTEAERHDHVFANPAFLEDAFDKLSGRLGARILSAWGFGETFVSVAEYWRDLSYLPESLEYIDFVRVGAALTEELGYQKDAVLNLAVMRKTLDSVSDVHSDEFINLRDNAKAIFS